MSLRDQLLKAGVVNKKKARKVDQQLKQERKQAQGQRDRKKEVQAREAQARAERLAQEAAERLARRQQAEAIKEAALRARLLASLVNTYQVRHRGGPQPFWHPTADGLNLHRLWLPESVAHDLRAGRLAVAWTGQDAADPDDYVLLADRAAQRIVEVAPQRVLFFNESPPDKDDPALELHPRDLPTSEPRLPRSLPERVRRRFGQSSTL